jgi:hypothetical protein
LAKVNLNTGNLETEFSTSPGMDSAVSALLIANSALYVGGSFTNYRGVSTVSLAKLSLTSGERDTGFSLNTGMNGAVFALAATGSHLFVGGAFTSYQSSTAQRLVKMNINTGSLDSAFTIASGANGTVLSLAIAGSLLYLAGDFTTYRDSTAQRLAAVNLTNGSLDPTFMQNMGTGANGTVRALAVSGPSLYLGGDFSTYRGATAQRLAKVDLTTGDLDQDFTQSTGASSTVLFLGVSGTALQAGGSFGTYRGFAAPNSAIVDLANGTLAD